MKKLFNLILAIALGFGLWSCSTEIGVNVDPDKTGTTALRFKISIPKDAYVTRGLAGTNEWTIKTLDVYSAVTGGNVARMVAGTDYTIDPAVGGTAKNYTITVNSAWIKAYNSNKANDGKTIRFYFVGNDTSSGGAHTELTTKTTEATFKNALTNALTETAGKLSPVLKPNGTNNLLFTAVTDPIVVTGIIQQNAALKRRAARFDIQNDFKSYFVVTKIVVENAANRALMFTTGNPASVTITKNKPHADIAGFAASAYTESYSSGTGNLAPSVFYLYPTIMGANATKVTIYGKLGSGAEKAYPVSIASAIDIKANFRYVIDIDPYEDGAVVNAIGEIDDAGKLGTAKPPVTPDGVVPSPGTEFTIGNTIWAGANVGEEPGTFASSGSAYGGLFPADDTESMSYYYDGPDVCPQGWRYPSVIEAQALIPYLESKSFTLPNNPESEAYWTYSIWPYDDNMWYWALYSNDDSPYLAEVYCYQNGYSEYTHLSVRCVRDK